MMTINNLQYLTCYLNRKTLLNLQEITSDDRINSFIKHKYGYIPVSLITLVNLKNEYLISFAKKMTIYINNYDIFIYTTHCQLYFELNCVNNTLLLKYAYLTNIRHFKNSLTLFYTYFKELLKKEIQVKKKERTLHFKNQIILLPAFIKCTLFHRGICVSI